MKLLLDTHIWIWSVSEPGKLPQKVRDVLQNAENSRWLSPISTWEALLLMERGRISISRDAPGLIREALRVSEVLEAPLTYEIAIESQRLIRFHDDPADRFLVATARVMDLTLVTADQNIIRSNACSVLAGV